MGAQLRLKLEKDADFNRDRFVVSAPNREAAQMLDAWPSGRGGALVLVGPSGAGKTHLAKAWAQRTHAEVITSAFDPGETDAFKTAMMFDGADVATHGEAFFHLLNKAAHTGCALLLTGRTPPKTWSAYIPDLRSRLNALQVIELGEPDDLILRGVLLKLFEQRHIRPPQDLMAYLLVRMERSVPAAQAMVAALDEAGSADHRPITRALAREILNDETDETRNED